MKMKQKTSSFLYKAGLLIGIGVIIAACSRKKDTWVNRNFHAMGTYYNILYHGNEALDLGKRQINQNYVDDYWEILPIERMEKTGDPIVYGEMVDLSEIKMPRRNVPQSRNSKVDAKKNGESNKGKSPKKNIQKKTNSAKDAFSNFNNNNVQNGRQVENQNSGVNNRNGRSSNQNNFDAGTGINNMNSGMNNQNSGMNNQNPGVNNQNMSNGGFSPNSGQNNNQFGNSNSGRSNQNIGRGNNTSPNRGGVGNRNENFAPTSMSQEGIGRNGNLSREGGNRMSSFASSKNMASSGMNNSGGGFGGERASEENLSSDEAFERAEEKATKAIQKHNMLINGEEHNPQMKDAFLLLGKSRYFDQRYFPALEAFNYIIHKYEDRQYITAAKIWREKTYMRLENYDRSIENLTSILNNNDNLDEENIVETSASLAEAYVNNDEKEKAIAPLNIAINTTRDNDKKGRYLFIKGQIFERLNKIDSANVAFNKVIALNRKSPRVYMINSYMEKAKNFDFKNGNCKAQLDTLKELLTDRENRPYLDIINYQTAEFYKATDTMSKAIKYYKKALRTGTQNHGLKFRIHKTLGNYYFDNAQYKMAGAYYDSTMVNLPEDSREYRTFRRKRLNLNDVIFYEDIAKRNDSILHLVGMNPEKRQAYFKNFTDSLKTVAIAQAKKAEKDSKRSGIAGNMFGRQASQAGGSSMFYFYNTGLVESGKQTFKMIWGNRDLQDNWRTEKGHSSNKKAEKEEKKVDYMAAIESNPNFQVQTYLDALPKDQNVIDSLSDERNFAYYQLGVIYNEKFKEYQLAAGKLEKLLKNDPEERLILPSKYNLYKIYQKLEGSSEANHWKQDILTHHPDSRYAKILRNPESLRNDKSNPETVYYSLYKNYKSGHYQTVINDCEKYITLFIGDDIVPKMELLKATAKGRLYGLDAYKKGLNYVALTYPQSEEGKKAEEIVTESLPKLENEKFVKNAEGNYNLIYTFSAKDKEDAEELQKNLDKAIEELEFEGLSTAIDTYSPEKIFVVVRGLRSRMGAEGFGEKLKKEKGYKIKHTNFGISSVNYKILLIHKNLDQYLKEFEN